MSQRVLPPGRAQPRGVGWAVVVPVKELGRAKSRLSGLPPESRSTLGRALAVDTIATVTEVVGASACFVVAAPSVRLALGAEAVRWVDEPPAGGLNAALLAGRDAALGDGHAAVALLVADLPLLSRDALAVALAAVPHDRPGMVRDRGGSGTTLLAARRGEQLRPAFGPLSGLRHLRAGAVDVSGAVDASLRDDVDTWQDLTRVSRGLTARRSATAHWVTLHAPGGGQLAEPLAADGG